MIDNENEADDLPLQHIMRTSAVILAGISLACGLNLAPAQSQFNEVRQAWDAQMAQTTTQSVVFQTEMMRRVFGFEVQVGGPVPRAFRAGKPWQLINPFAPAEFGDGADNLSTDPQTGQPVGFRVLDIRF